MTDTEPRGPGRPRSNRIDFVNIDCCLKQNPKFIKFKRLAKLSEKDAWATITALFAFVGQHRALSGSLADLDPEIVAEACFWNQNPDDLFSALKLSEIVGDELTITNWFQNQPHVTKKLHNYKYYEKQKDSTSQPSSQTISDNSGGRNLLILGEEKQREEKQREEKSMHACTENVDNLPEMPENKPPNLSTLSKKFIKTADVDPKSKDATTIRKWISKLLSSTDSTTTQNLLNDLAEAVAENRVNNPIGCLISNCKKIIDKQQKSEQPQTPIPVCPECNKELYIGAISCPNCGWKSNKLKKLDKLTDKRLGKPTHISKPIQSTLDQLKAESNSPE